jgi:hypothetical protein
LQQPDNFLAFLYCYFIFNATPPGRNRKFYQNEDLLWMAPAVSGRTLADASRSGGRFCWQSRGHLSKFIAP